MKPFTKQLIFLAIVIIVFGIGIVTVIAVNNRGAAPVAYWKFDEGYGPTAFDAAGANDGTIYNALWRNEPDCKTGKCLYFDGNGDYVNAGTAASLDITNKITVEAWIKLNGHNYRQLWQTITGRADNAVNSFWFFVNDARTVQVRLGDNIGYTSATPAIEYGNWYHLTFTYDKDGGSNNFHIYVNGVSMVNQTFTGSIDSADGKALLIGYSDNNYAVNGLIDDVRIYNYARTPAQIKADYQSGASRGSSVIQNSKFKIQNSSEGLLGHWKMDETSWTVNCSTDTIMDSSGSGKHGDGCPNAGGLAPAAGKYGNAGVFDGTEDYIKIPDVDF